MSVDTKDKITVWNLTDGRLAGSAPRSLLLTNEQSTYVEPLAVAAAVAATCAGVTQLRHLVAACARAMRAFGPGTRSGAAASRRARW